MRSHTSLPDALHHGHQTVDQLSLLFFKTACVSRVLLHQPAAVLHRQFSLSHAGAQDIIKSCPSWQSLAQVSTNDGVSPRGLKSNQLWQMDVTHVNSFGHLKFVHIIVDT